MAKRNRKRIKPNPPKTFTVTYRFKDEALQALAWSVAASDALRRLVAAIDDKIAKLRAQEEAWDNAFGGFRADLDHHCNAYKAACAEYDAALTNARCVLTSHETPKDANLRDPNPKD